MTARTEFYTEPAVLPTVQQGSIKLDLHRRDFTINTLALCLNPDRWGNLLDFWNGLNDLNAGLVRAPQPELCGRRYPHLRAVRYEQRFGFRIEARTLELLRDALELLDRVTPTHSPRTRTHLEEEEPEKAMLRLHELDVLHALHPELRMTDAMVHQFVRLRELRSREGAIVYWWRPRSSCCTGALLPINSG